MKILIVDDTNSNRLLLECYLKKAEHELVFANNGLDGLEKLAKYSPDLIISDLEMPVMDGIEMLLKVREMMDIPIIIVSSNNNQRIKEKCFLYGANYFFIKPVSKNLLIETIRLIEHSL